MDVYGEQSWWNFSCDLYISLFDGRPKRHRSDLQMSLWMEILSREKLHLLIYFVLFLTTLRMCYRSIKGILGSCESLCLLFIMLFNFFWFLLLWDRCGSFWDRPRSFEDRCGSFRDLVTTTSIYLQIVCISSRFRVLHLLSWEFEQSEIPWRYTFILVGHLLHVEVGWSTRNHPYTGHLS